MQKYGHDETNTRI